MQPLEKGVYAEEEIRLRMTAAAQAEKSELPFPDLSLSGEDKLTQDAPAEPAPTEDKDGEQALLMEKPRGVLEEKSLAGLSAEVRALLKAHGANSLSKVDPAEYPALLSDAEKLGGAAEASAPSEIPSSEEQPESSTATPGADPNTPESQPGAPEHINDEATETAALAASQGGGTGISSGVVPAVALAQQHALSETWMKSLECNRDGKVLNTTRNYIHILRYDETLRAIRYNVFTGSLSVDGSLPWNQITPGWSNLDNSCLRKYISDTYGIWPSTTLENAMAALASQERVQHPVKEFIERVPWDGMDRLDTLLVTYLGAEDTPYTREVIRKALIAAVARIYQPGIKFDYVLVLVGTPGVGKSMLFSKLGGPWFSDSLGFYDMKDKTAGEKLQGRWILEIPELAGMSEGKIEIIKSFITRVSDVFRPAYGRDTEVHPRTCILVATTNALHGFLLDTTGNRRFLPVQVSGKSKLHPWDLRQEVVSQIWAEAYEAYKSGESLVLSEAGTTAATAMQKAAMVSDDREGMVREYLDTPLPDNWAKMNLHSRLQYLDHGNKSGTVHRERVCTAEIWCECFRKDRADMKREHTNEITQMLCKLDDSEAYHGKLSFPNYGAARAFVRVPKKIHKTEP
ncbi:virulence-associated E family protein [Oscillibacter sp.]|uniref:virulence-associated E family protein n=1 Tax=Oscillibacter sp. TaxID=1945593 RepID=UPI002899A212|nr:virulence-associated E family protein [Oscillibacter sp.]